MHCRHSGRRLMAGAALGIGFYWGGEKRDHEIKVQHIPALAVWR